MHLAQFNIGHMAYDLDDPRAADFVNGIEMVNRVAEQSEGFVWKYETGMGGIVDEDVDSDPRMLVNMSVWQSIEALRCFTYKTLHKQFVARKAEWFKPLDRAHFVMWWVMIGHRPTLKEAQDKLALLRKNGSTQAAFGWDFVSSPAEPAQ